MTMRKEECFDNARACAAYVVQQVIESDDFAKDILDRCLEASQFEPRDAGFVTELSYGTLRWYQALFDSLNVGQN